MILVTIVTVVTVMTVVTDTKMYIRLSKRLYQQ